MSDKVKKKTKSRNSKFKINEKVLISKKKFKNKKFSDFIPCINFVNHNISMSSRNRKKIYRPKITNRLTKNISFNTPRKILNQNKKKKNIKFFSTSSFLPKSQSNQNILTKKKVSINNHFFPNLKYKKFKNLSINKTSLKLSFENSNKVTSKKEYNLFLNKIVKNKNRTFLNDDKKLSNIYMLFKKLLF